MLVPPLVNGVKTPETTWPFSHIVFTKSVSAFKLLSEHDSFWTDLDVTLEDSNLEAIGSSSLFDLYLKPKNRKLPFKQI